MFNIVITEKGGKPRVEEFDQNEITIGRVQGNDIVLPKGNISKRHSRIVLRDGKFIVVDLKSTNGTYVNGKRINSPQVLKEVDKVYIGDFTLTVEEPAQEEAPPEEDMNIDDINDIINEADDDDDDDDGDDLFDDDAGGEDLDFEEDIGGDFQAEEPEPAPPPKPQKAPAPPAPKPKRKKAATPPPPPPKLDVDLPPAGAMNARAAVFSSVLKALQGGDENAIPAADDNTLAKAEGAAEKTLQAVAKKLAGVNTDGWAKEIASEVCGIGPIAQLFEDDGVTEVFVNGPHLLVCKNNGATEASNTFFSSSDALDLVLRRVLQQGGQQFDAEHPVGEAHFDDLRFDAVHQSAATQGPLVTVTRSSHTPLHLDGLVEEEVLSANMASFLRTCVHGRKGVLVVGTPGADTDCLTAAIASEAADHERVVVVERTSKLSVQKPHVLSLQAAGTCRARDIVAGALRMRPDRLVVSELSGGEALDVILAMTAQQAGAIASTTAADARSGLSRLETMMQVGAQETSARAVREQIAAAVSVVVVLTSYADGTDKVTEIVEVSGTEVDLITTQELFVYKNDAFKAKGTPPRFYEELQKRGIDVDMGVFRD